MFQKANTASLVTIKRKLCSWRSSRPLENDSEVVPGRPGLLCPGPKDCCYPSPSWEPGMLAQILIHHTPTHTHTHTHTHWHTQRDTQRHMHTQRDTHTRTHTHRHTHTDTCTHREKHTHIYVHTETLSHREAHTHRDRHRHPRRDPPPRTHTTFCLFPIKQNCAFLHKWMAWTCMSQNWLVQWGNIVVPSGVTVEAVRSPVQRGSWKKTPGRKWWEPRGLWCHPNTAMLWSPSLHPRTSIVREIQLN